MADFSKQMDMVLYNSDDGEVSVNAYIQDESLWVTQKAMAELFGIEKSRISKHLKNIFDTAETNFYNLDAIISVGYKVNSKRATQFRIWATKKSR